jgi:predicted Zn-dependent protease with MMP-like domain
MTAENGVKEQVLEALDTLPEEALEEVAVFVDYLQYKLKHRTLYKPIALGGLWAGVTIAEEDIAAVRQEMWGDFGEREL